MKNIMPAAGIIFLVLVTAMAGFQLIGTEAGNHKEGGDVKSGPYKTAVFAGGCFWCVESDFEKVPGVISVVSGYTGGVEPNPTYEEVSSGSTGHKESVEVTYDPRRVSYSDLLDYFWRHVDPTDAGGQFVDQGPQYTSAIFVANEEERRLALESKARLEALHKFDKPIVTQILPRTKFYPAEGYHQLYSKKHELKYKYYRWNSGRDQFLDKIWGKDRNKFHSSAGAFVKPDDATLRKKLTSLQYDVTQREGTEPSFKNAYWNNEKAGIYVDIVSGEPLFSSLDKFDSGTGWPSFTKPIEPGSIVTREDHRLFSTRTEVRSRLADSHLGHVFNDGPPPTGLRYCMNSAALRFVPASDLEKEGYGKYKALFER